MFFRAKENKKSNKGFSLVELIVVIAIMAVLVAVLAPQFTKYIDRSRQSNDATTVSGIVTAVQVGIVDSQYKSDSTNYTIVVNENGTQIYEAADATGTPMEKGDGTASKPNNIVNAITDSCGELDTLKATASKWKSTGITVKINVSAEGAISTTYEGDFKTYIEQQ